MYITDYGKAYFLRSFKLRHQNDIFISQKTPIDVFEKVKFEDGLSVKIGITYNGMEKHFMIIDCVENAENTDRLWFHIFSNKIGSTNTIEESLVRSSIERFYNE